MRLVESAFDHFGVGMGGELSHGQVLEWLADSAQARAFCKALKDVTTVTVGVLPATPEEGAAPLRPLWRPC